MKNNILEFDKRSIDISELQDHIKFYIYKSEEGFKLLSNGDKKAAMEILQEIRKIMKPEYDYYNRYKIQNIIYNDHNYNNYYSAIIDIIGSQKDSNAYDNLDSYLDDVQYAMRWHCGELLEEWL